MDLLSQHEAFLRAIFDNPEDDTARLVYADFLQENGEEDRAEFIRVQWERSHPQDVEPARWLELAARLSELSESAVPWNEMLSANGSALFNRGLWREGIAPGVLVSANDLDDPWKFREWVVRVNPAWYGESKLYVRPGSQLSPEHVRTLCELPFVRQIKDWNLSGQNFFDLPDMLSEAEGNDYSLALFTPRDVDAMHRAAVTTTGVNALARLRAASRITSLDLRNNNLDNDAALALAKSPYLDNLKHLRMLEGNRFRGKVWQQVIERFGEDVVE